MLGDAIWLIVIILFVIGGAIGLSISLSRDEDGAVGILIVILLAVIFVGALGYALFNTVSPNAETDTLIEVVSEVREEHVLCYSNGSCYSKDAAFNELVSYVGGMYKVYLCSENENTSVSRLFDKEELLEPEFNSDAIPKVEEILTINYYADKDSGDKMWLPIIETKYRFVLPSEEYWHE